MSKPKAEANRMLDFLCTAGPYANTTATREQVNEIMTLTGGSMLMQGRLVDIISKKIGPDVWKLTRGDRP